MGDLQGRFKMKIIALFIVAVFAISLANAVLITDCGSYNVTSSDKAFQSGIVINANASSTITNGACVFIKMTDSSGTSKLYMNNSVIIQNGSTATYGIYVTHTGGSTIYFGGLYGSGEIVGFQTGVGINGTSDTPLSMSASNISVYNGIFGFMSQEDAHTSANYNIGVCNTTFAANMSSYNFTDITIFSVPGCAYSFNNAGANRLLMNGTANSLKLLYADHAFAGEWNMTVNSASSSLRGAKAYSFRNGEYYFLPPASATTDQYVYLQSINGTYQPYDNLTALNASIVGQYCISSSACNRLFLNNYSSWPFYIWIPTDPTTMFEISTTADEIYVYQVVGGSSFLVLSDRAPMQKMCGSGTSICAWLVQGSTYDIVSVVGGVSTTQRVQALCYSGVCYLSGYSSGPVANATSYMNVGLCTQLDITRSKCDYFTNNPNATNFTWTMRMINLNDSSVVCEANGTGAVGTIICSYPGLLGGNAAVQLFLQPNMNSQITASFHLEMGLGNMQYMWIMIYVGAVILLAYVATGIPIIMALSQLVLAYLFYIAKVLPDFMMVLAVSGWLAILFMFIIGAFKKDTRSG